MHDVASPPHEGLRSGRSNRGDANPARCNATARQLRAQPTFDVPRRLGIIQHCAADERVLAISRLFGAGVLLIASATDPLHGRGIQLLVLAYVLHAGTVAVGSALRPEWTLRRAPLVHAVDLLWGVAATVWTGGADSSIFPVFTFVLVGSAFRWGLRATLRDAAVIGFVTLVEAFYPISNIDRSPAQVHFALVRIAYIGIAISLLFGVLTQRQNALRHQTAVLADLVSRVSRATRLQAAVRDTLARVLTLFEARHLIVVVEDLERGAVERWRADARSDGAVVLTHVALPRHDREAWTYSESCCAGACELRRPGRDGKMALVGTALEACKHPGPITTVPAAIANASSWAVLAVTPLAAVGIWKGHVYLLDPAMRPAGELRLRLLQSVIQQVMPALVNLYLLGRLRSRAEAVERARISRELHDGALPSLAGIEMRLEALRRAADVVVPGLARDLREVRDQLHDEATDLRALMQRLRSPDVDAQRLSGEIADQVARFARTTGIDARFEWGAEGLDLSRHSCTEIARVVQEALFNVRRHSGADRVWVRAQTHGRAWLLIIEDNGRGMGFTGRLKHEQLDACRKGPRVILDRVAALGGAVDIESGPGGTRLAITLPVQPAEQGIQKEEVIEPNYV